MIKMDYLTVEEVAQELRLKPYTVREMLRNNKMPGHKFGEKEWRIEKTEYEEWKKQRRNQYNSSQEN